MKTNVFLMVIGVVLACLLSYLVLTLACDSDSSLTFGIGSMLGFLVTLVPLIGARHNSHRLAVNLNVLSALFFVLLLVCNVCFAMFNGPIPYFIISNGVLVVAYVVAFYKISRLDQ